MKTSKYVFVTVLVVMGTVGFARAGIGAKASEQIVVEGNSKFALKLYAELRAKEGNLFFSPYSISTALAMTYAGAKGETETQMAGALHFPVAIKPDAETVTTSHKQFHSAFGEIIKDLNERGAKDRYQLTVANALWGQKGFAFLDEFVELIEVNYAGGLNEVDFIQAAETARKTINDWVQKETENKIKNLIGPGVLNNLTRLVLTNAIYFKGNWERQFKKDKTKDAPFTLIDGRKIDAPMMNQTAKFNYMETETFQALELPYVDNEL